MALLRPAHPFLVPTARATAVHLVRWDATYGLLGVAPGAWYGLHAGSSGTVGEVYFSEIRPRYLKAWKRHMRMTQRFAVPVGAIRFVIHDQDQIAMVL